MDSVYFRLIDELSPDKKDGIGVFEGSVEGEEPLVIKAGGEALPFFTKNSDLVLKEGERCLCLQDGDNIYIICKVG